MRINLSIKYCLIIIFVLVGHLAFSQLSKTHYIPPLTSSSFGNANPEDQYIYLSTPSNTDVPFTIIPVGQSASNNITGIVSNTNPVEIFLGTGNGQLFIPSTQTSTVVSNRGYIIEAENVVYVSVRMNAGGGAQAGALVSKGGSALGTTFRVGSYTNENPQDNYLNFVSVMATEDDTQVSFSNLPAGLIIKNYTGSTPVNTILDKGESYTIATNSLDTTINRDGLIGTLVSSNKPIVVNCGSTNGSFDGGGGRDYGIDQIVGVSKVGKEYIFVKGDGNNAWENILIVAHTDNTTISINGNTPIATINAGNYYLIEGNMYNTNGNMYVNTSEDVFAYQGVGATGSEANQGMFFVPPLSCEARGNLDNIANIGDIGNTSYTGGLSIVTKVGATITINGNLISSFNSVGPSAVTGKPDYVTYKVLNLNGNISVQSSDELYCAYFNFNGAATSGSFYSGFPSAPEINFDAQFTTLGNCIPNIKLSAANAQVFDSFRWLFDDGNGSGFIDLIINNSEITPTQPGKYKLIGIITCTGEELESAEIPVSICPDDIDNDGIIDNLDIDNDNDGILNCTESKGDVTLNLVDFNFPELIFQDGSANNTIATGSFNTTGGDALNVDALGNFRSIVGASANAENNSSLSFTEPVNFKFVERISNPHNTIDGEFFIVKILPINKNITLVDPDNRLLVDSNFDGVFETGVTIISGSEIHFKVNPSPNGTTTPYQFYANQIDSFSFIHKVENTTESSIISLNMYLTCFKNDHDLDGIKDELDLDSDNDGIPDIIENQSSLVTLSGIDTDINGLDDVFDSTTLPLDTDGDGILDFYDLDSDNDGIFDLIETGQLGTLSDTNLDGIEDGPTYGINGWADAAETNPDSDIINYTLNDLDADTIFSYIDSDSDGDNCSDVIEAGFSDANGDAFLGDLTIITNASGLVTNASDGYTLPNTNYLDFAPITITTQPSNIEVCLSSTANISIISPDADTYQWEVSTNAINWNTIIDSPVYSGSQTGMLTISNIPSSFNNYQYRVKLDRNGNSCGIYSDEVEVKINPLPTVNSSVNLIQCDDDDLATLGFSPFNLAEVNNEISANASNETFSYYVTQAAAISGDITSLDYISNPTTFINRTMTSDVVWARIESQLGCVSISQIQLNVSTTVIPSTFLATFNQCDDFLDANGNDNTNNDDRDGIATFDFSSVTATILSFIPSGQNPLPPRYYRNEADALAEINEITDPSNYRNIGFPRSQFIYIRIDSAIANDCLGLGAHVLLNVEALPIANSVTIPRQCDDDIDGEFPFNTSQIESTVLGSQNPADVFISYFDANSDPLLYANGTGVTSPIQPTFLTADQTITIRVTNNATTTIDGPCYDETTLEFIVDKQPIITNTIPDQVFCDDGMDATNEEDGLHSFDTSSFESTIIGSQTGMTIYFDYIDQNGTFVDHSTSLPNPLISGNQTITVEVINPINPSCTANTSIKLIVNPLPEFSINPNEIVCTSDPTFTIILDPFEASVIDVFNYEWTWTNLEGTIINQFISNEDKITISDPGTYSITLTKTDGTGCSKTRTVFVDVSELATITKEDVIIDDLSENNTVTIDPTNLGTGNYEYALREEGSNFIVYQDSPIFNNVLAGFYTIYVRDAVCGISTPLDISVIGHPKFFTPNNDGKNDFWTIRGISTTVQPNSIIFIYDRYGKLLKQLSTQEKGWDGTFNSRLLSTDDYWFKVFLQDGREYMGHFSLKR